MVAIEVEEGDGRHLPPPHRHHSAPPIIWWRREQPKIPCGSPCGRRGKSSRRRRCFTSSCNWISCRSQGCLVQSCSSLGFSLLCWATMTAAPASRSRRTGQRWIGFGCRGNQFQLDLGLAGRGGDGQGSLPAVLLNLLEDLQQVCQFVSHFHFLHRI